MTSERFKQGYLSGIADAQNCTGHVFTLDDFSLRMTSRQSDESAHHAGYIAGFLDGFTQGTIDDLKQRQGTLCETFGHHWRATNRPGKFYCCNCRATGYCPGCLLTLPKAAMVMRCAIHQEAK